MTTGPPTERQLPPAKPSSRLGQRREAQNRKGAEAFSVSPFARLARAHGCSAGGDALFAIALADSIFFSIDPNDARWRVAVYLLVTAAPFGVVAPWLGPAMDRLKGGHRYMMIGAAAMRAILIFAVAFNIDSFLLFPLAFSMLVMGKTHHVAKSALVPGIVRREDELVTANSRLSIISAISAAVAGAPGVLLLTIGGAEWTLFFGALIFTAGAILGFAIPATQLAADPPDADEKAEMRGAGIILAASAMGYVRGVVGFLTMLLAFELRGGIDPGPTGAGVEIGHRVREALGGLRLDLTTGGSPAWHFGAVLLATGVGGLVGGLASPRLRAVAREERILAGVLGGVAAFGVLAALSGGLIGAMIAAFSVAIAGQTGKQAFDAIIQRDAKGSNLGRSFSRFESRFQLVWVLGALIPVIVPIPARLGFLIVAAASAFAAASYWLGRDPSPSTAKPKAAAKRAAKKMNDRKAAAAAAAGEAGVEGAEHTGDPQMAGGQVPFDPAHAPHAPTNGHAQMPGVPAPVRFEPVDQSGVDQSMVDTGQMQPVSFEAFDAAPPPSAGEPEPPSAPAPPQEPTRVMPAIRMPDAEPPEGEHPITPPAPPQRPGS